METWCSNLACHNFSSVPQKSSAVTVSAQQGNTQKAHIYSPKGQQAFFSFTYIVALNYTAGGDDGCLHIMDALLILLVELLKMN